MLKERLHLVVSGRVQGVGFRQWTRRTALELGLVGWVRNLPDGRVELVAVGTRDALRQLETLCLTGPSLARVDDISSPFSQSEQREDFSSFEIR